MSARERAHGSRDREPPADAPDGARHGRRRRDGPGRTGRRPCASSQRRSRPSRKSKVGRVSQDAARERGVGQRVVGRIDEGRGAGVPVQPNVRGKTHHGPHGALTGPVDNLVHGAEGILDAVAWGLEAELVRAALGERERVGRLLGVQAGLRGGRAGLVRRRYGRGGAGRRGGDGPRERQRARLPERRRESCTASAVSGSSNRGEGSLPVRIDCMACVAGAGATARR